MKKYILILSVAILAFGCSQAGTISQTQPVKSDTSKKPATKKLTATILPDSAQDEYPRWVDTLIDSYIKQTNNPLVKNAREEKRQEGWGFEGIKKTDTATYWWFHIGHDVTDEGGTNPRYIHDSWVYVDSLKRKLYEYDSTNEKIVEWKE